MEDRKDLRTENSQEDLIELNNIILEIDLFPLPMLSHRSIVLAS